ncbi:hypothetical protein Tco_0698862 [Tanacetum coccineum]
MEIPLLTLNQLFIPLHEYDAECDLEKDIRKELKICEAKTNETSIDEPPEVELKDLPPHLEYAFLEGDNKLPVIIAKDLSVLEKTALIKVLQSHKRAIAWKLSDIKGINPEFCTHKILMEEDYTPAVQHQRRFENEKNEVDPNSFGYGMAVKLDTIVFSMVSQDIFQIPMRPNDPGKRQQLLPIKRKFREQRDVNPAEKKISSNTEAIISGKDPFCLKSVAVSRFIRRCVFWHGSPLYNPHGLARWSHRWTITVQTTPQESLTIPESFGPQSTKMP